MAGQQRARDGQDCLPAPGMGGLGRKIEVLFLVISPYYSTNKKIILRNGLIYPLTYLNKNSG